MNRSVSIVIPTYNRSALLSSTLGSLIGINYPSDLWNVIVVDDGSSDDTFAQVSGFADRLDLIFVHQADRGFRAGRARNLGLRLSANDVVILLDTGVVVGRNFIREHVASLSVPNTLVSVGYVYGFSNDDSNAAALEAAIVGADFDSVMDRFQRESTFLDIREDVFRTANDDLMSLPAPWALAWTCNLAVDRSGAGASTLFDETFVGWGAEDLDYALTLYRGGAGFTLTRGASGLHLPHEKSEAANTTSSLRNKKYLDRKRRLDETKVLVTVSAVDLNNNAV